MRVRWTLRTGGRPRLFRISAQVKIIKNSMTETDFSMR